MEHPQRNSHCATESDCSSQTPGPSPQYPPVSGHCRLLPCDQRHVFRDDVKHLWVSRESPIIPTSASRSPGSPHASTSSNQRQGRGSSTLNPARPKSFLYPVVQRERARSQSFPPNPGVVAAMHRITAGSVRFPDEDADTVESIETQNIETATRHSWMDMDVTPEAGRSTPSVKPSQTKYIVSPDGQQMVVEDDDLIRTFHQRASMDSRKARIARTSRCALNLDSDEEINSDAQTTGSTAFVGIVEFHGVTWKKGCYCTIFLTTRNRSSDSLSPGNVLHTSLWNSKNSIQTRLSAMKSHAMFPEDKNSAKAHIQSIRESALPSEVFFVNLDRETEWYISIKIKKYGFGKMLKREMESIFVPFLTNGEIQLSRQGTMTIRSGWLSVQPTRQGCNLGLEGYRYRCKRYHKKSKKWSTGFVVIQFRDVENSRLCVANIDNALQISINLSNIKCVAAADERVDEDFVCRIFYVDTPEQEGQDLPAPILRLRLIFLSKLSRVSFVERLLMRMDPTFYEPKTDRLKLFVGTWNAGNVRPQLETYQRWIPTGMDMYCITGQELVWFDDVKIGKASFGPLPPSAVEPEVVPEADFRDNYTTASSILGSEMPGSPTSADRTEEEDCDAASLPLEREHEKKQALVAKVHKMRSLAKSASSSVCGINFNREVALHLGLGYVMLTCVVNYDRVMSVFVHWKLFGLVDETEVSSSLLAKFGNKGAVGCKVKIRLKQDIPTSLIFAGAHLSAGEESANCGVRNNQYRSICDTLVFKDHRGIEFPEDADACFFSGDLNYRLALKADETKKDIVDQLATKNGCKLRDRDELFAASSSGVAFPGKTWREGDFSQNLPSYKLDTRKSEDNAKIETKFANYGKGDNVIFNYDAQRVPAWCDRILWRPCYGTVDVVQEQLNVCATSGKSDHAPVGATFALKERLIQRVPWKLMCPERLVVSLDAHDVKFLRVCLIADFITDDDDNKPMTSLIKGQDVLAKDGKEHKNVFTWDSKMTDMPQIQIAPPFSYKMTLATPLRLALWDGDKQLRGHALLPFHSAKESAIKARSWSSGSRSKPGRQTSKAKLFTNRLSIVKENRSFDQETEMLSVYHFHEPVLHRGLVIGDISLVMSVE
eukprot:GEMP01004184.1.p1 GENE.GEMP01004184.1~~GEMP01004184.1.p1  ORF type:complete len:1113 (+),score=218.99 GEMP01004184.1:79-3417(+)